MINKNTLKVGDIFRCKADNSLWSMTLVNGISGYNNRVSHMLYRIDGVGCIIIHNEKFNNEFDFPVLTQEELLAYKMLYPNFNWEAK